MTNYSQETSTKSFRVCRGRVFAERLKSETRSLIKTFVDLALRRGATTITNGWLLNSNESFLKH